MAGLFFCRFYSFDLVPVDFKIELETKVIPSKGNFGDVFFSNGGICYNSWEGSFFGTQTYQNNTALQFTMTFLEWLVPRRSLLVLFKAHHSQHFLPPGCSMASGRSLRHGTCGTFAGAISGTSYPRRCWQSLRMKHLRNKMSELFVCFCL